VIGEMRNLERNMAFSMVYVMVFIFAVQASFLVSHDNYYATHSYVQPSCTDFSRWVQNPSQYQNNNEICHGLGLIPAPVDFSVVPVKTLPVPGSQKLLSLQPEKIIRSF